MMELFYFWLGVYCTIGAGFWIYIGYTGKIRRGTYGPLFAYIFRLVLWAITWPAIIYWAIRYGPDYKDEEEK